MDPHLTDAEYEKLTEDAKILAETGDIIVSRIGFKVAVASAYKLGFKKGFERGREHESALIDTE